MARPKSEDVETLKSLLKDSVDIFDGKTPKAIEHPQRCAAALQLHAVREFLRRCGIPEPLMRPLGELLAALGDAERGTDNPMLRPRHRAEGGRPPPLLYRDRRRVTAAAAIDLLMKSGATEGAAADEVVHRLKKAGLDIGSSSALRAFRDRLATGEADGAAFYQKEILRTRGMVPIEGANWLIAGLIAALTEETS